MKLHRTHVILTFAAIMSLWYSFPAAASAGSEYTPSKEIRESQKEFSDARFGIFLHWGIYSMMGQGEWYLNYGPDAG